MLEGDAFFAAKRALCHAVAYRILAISRLNPNDNSSSGETPRFQMNPWSLGLEVSWNNENIPIHHSFLSLEALPRMRGRD